MPFRCAHQKFMCKMSPKCSARNTPVTPKPLPTFRTEHIASFLPRTDILVGARLQCSARNIRAINQTQCRWRDGSVLEDPPRHGACRRPWEHQNGERKTSECSGRNISFGSHAGLKKARRRAEKLSECSERNICNGGGAGGKPRTHREKLGEMENNDHLCPVCIARSSIALIYLVQIQFCLPLLIVFVPLNLGEPIRENVPAGTFLRKRNQNVNESERSYRVGVKEVRASLSLPTLISS